MISIDSLQHRWIHCKYQILMAVSLALLLGYPFILGTRFGEVLADTLTNFVFLAALIAVSKHRAVLHLAIVLFCPALLLTWLPLIEESGWQRAAEMLATGLYVGYVTWQIFVEVFSQRNIKRDTLFGAVCVFLLLGLLWSYLYALLHYTSPGAFNLAPQLSGSSGELSANLLYFSYTTLTTVGYGDITPLSLTARSITTVEQIVGVFYVAIMISRLVSMHQQSIATNHEHEST